MKQKRLLSMLVLLMTVVTGAWAQAQTYKVTLQEGTEDATNWTVPEEAAEGATVTVTYNGTKKVKSVKAVKKGGALATPLTMEALTAGNIVVYIVDPYEMGPVELVTGMKYSVNGGEKHLITTTTTIEDLVAGDKVQFYGNGNSTQVYVVMLQGTAQTKVYGNIMSLIDETGYATLTTLPNRPAVFMGLFSENTNLTDASGLLLPAITLTDYCYFGMFSGCTSLTTAPELPAPALANSCYTNMFSSCTSLTTAPTLPAETLAEDCYNHMFQGCTSLVTAPALPVTTLAEGCYAGMFSGCTSLTTAPALPATTLAETCYNHMFDGCTSLTTAPALPATTLFEDCYSGMFEGCTSLTTAPVLPATTLANSCYESMFKNCSNLASVTCLATDISASYCIKNWLLSAGSAVQGTKMFYKAASMTDWGTNIPEGWTVKDAPNN